MGVNHSKVKRDARRIRKLVIRATTAAGSGHPGGSFSMAEIMGVLFGGHLKHDPTNPGWEGRDRLVLSKGHAAPGLFASLAVAGYINESEMTTLRSFGSRLQGHPDLKCPGVEFCGGSLGIGLSFSVGMALAARIDGRMHRVYTIIGDGESDEGQVWEAAMTAAKYKTDNLTTILDRNYIQQDSYTEEIMPLDGGGGAGTDASEKWHSFGWNVITIDGHRIEEIDRAIHDAALRRGHPSMIVARTVKGKGVEHMENNPKWHGKAADPQIAPIIEEELDCQTAVAPSIIAGDLSNLEGETRRCSDGGADYIHLDVMDGKFVPYRTFGPEKIREIRPVTDVPFDSHLMIAEPVRHVMEYVEAGSDVITVHAEACDESSFGEIHDRLGENQVGAGLAINPETELPEWSAQFVSTLDQVIVMSVVPGKSGQSYMEPVHAKTARLFRQLRDLGFEGTIEADGGVSSDNVARCFADGARTFVGGSAIVGRPDAGAAMAEFRTEILGARRMLLLRKTIELGGTDLLERWIGLHATETKDVLEGMARREGLI